MIASTAVNRRIALACLALLVPGPVVAQGATDFPARPLRIIVGQTTGGLVDISARLYARELEARLRQPVVVDNRPGASGLIGARMVSTASPDGYTLHLASGLNQSRLLMKGGLDIPRDLAPVSLLMTTPWVFLAGASTPARSFRDLVAYAKAQPGRKLNYGSPGILNSLAMEVIKSRLGIDYVNVMYKGSAPIAQALLTGEIDVAISTPPPYLAAIQAGKLRALFVTRSTASLPGVPTAEEAGLGDFSPTVNLGAWTTPGTPREVIAKLAAEFAAVTALPQIQERIRTALGAEPVGSTAEEMRRVVEQEFRFWTEAVRLAKFEPE